MKEWNKGLKAGIYLGLIVVVTAMVIIANYYVAVEKEPEWKKVFAISSDLLVTGENSLGDGDSGWLSTFCLDYGETPGAVLNNNATDWSASATAMGYLDADDTNSDLKSEDPFYFVVRCRFNDSCKDGADFIGSRCRCKLTVSGDESIAGVYQYGDITGATGGGIVSQNGSTYIYINFYWDDGVDGYRITDDGALAWAIEIEMKY